MAIAQQTELFSRSIYNIYIILERDFPQRILKNIELSLGNGSRGMQSYVYDI